MINYEILYDSLGFHIGRTARVIKNCLSREFAQNDFGISSEQWHMLLILWQRKNMPQKELTLISSKDKTTTARIIGGLEAKGLIRKESNKKDKRNKIIYITSKGRQLEEKLMPVAIGVNDKIEGSLSHEESAELRKLLTKIYYNLKNESNNNQEE